MNYEHLKQLTVNPEIRLLISSLETIFPQSGFFITDKNKKVLYWSSGLEKLLGFQARDVVGENCLKSNRCITCIQGCGVEEYTLLRDIPLTLYNDNGQPIHVRKFASALRDENNHYQGSIEILLPANYLQPIKPSEDIQKFHGILTKSSAMTEVFRIVRQVSESDVNILIRGESGTGKELIAKAIHQESSRNTGPFVAVNCSALSPNLLESLLFGHKKGAFTGAVRDHIGLFEQANKGTLFLDEIGEMPIEIQSKLLRVLEERKITPLGSTMSKIVDVRILSATHRSLRQQIKLGQFREDLMYRLRVVPIFLPPLRKRKEDIELLLWHFINHKSKGQNTKIHQITPSAMRKLLDYHWPGNIRELRNIVEYAFAVCDGHILSENDLPPEFNIEKEIPIFFSDQSDEKQKILESLKTHNGHLGKVAEDLGISRPTLWRKRKKYKI